MRAHLWTVVPRLRDAFAAHAPAAERWRGVVDDRERGAVPLSGLLCRPAGAATVVVLVHGLGGSSESSYLAATAGACDAAGAATLRLNLRGSDGEAGDFYHAGLTADVHAALASPALASFPRVAVVGFSLGGHVALRHATEPGDSRLVAVAAVCAPLELQPAQRAIDRPGAWLYRTYLLRRLMTLYAAVACHGPVPTPVSAVRRVRTLREWDRLTVVPRFGFTDPEDYYARASVGPRLAALRVPALLVASPADPMVPAESIRQAAAVAGGRLDLRWVARGGHVAFSRRLDLGVAAASGLPAQLAGWLLAERADPRRAGMRAGS